MPERWIPERSQSFSPCVFDFKGTVKLQTFQSALSVHALMVFKVFQKFSTTLNTIINLLFPFFENANFDMLFETLLRIPFHVIGRCSLMPTSNWLQGKCALINPLLAVFGMVLQNRKWIPLSIFSVKIAALGSLKRLTGRIFKISK
jgi:hypothetical protein